ncbi:MAG: NYN domain-containing protein [Cyanobacteria bacterium P01_B01_bin.77]
MLRIPENIEVFHCPRIGQLITDVSKDKRGRVNTRKTSWFAELCIPEFYETLPKGSYVYALARIKNTLLIVPKNYLKVFSLKDKFTAILYGLLSQENNQPVTSSLLKKSWQASSHNFSITMQRQTRTQENILGDDKQSSAHSPHSYRLTSLLDSKESELHRVHPLSRQRNSVAVFIDGSNLFHAASAMNAHINYRSLLKCLVAKRFLVGAFFYTGFNAARRSERSFLKRLRCEGYQVIDKKLVSRSDGSKKANLDVEIALDMVRYANSGNCDSIILVSGDGDFIYAVECVKAIGITVDVIGLRSMTSRSLIRAADRYVDLEEIQHLICLNSPSHRKSITTCENPQKQQYKQAA